MLIPIATMKGEDEEDTKLLEKMAVEARSYITSFHWCLPIKAAFLADGIGGVVALFLFEFESKIGGTDDKLWVVTGDLPTAYMIVEPEDSASKALERYCLLMDDWVAAVHDDSDFEDVFPVAAARTKEHADMLESRLAFLRREIIPEITTDFVTDSNGEVVTRD